MSNPTNPILECSGLYKSFTEAGTLVQVLNDINLTVAAGETIAIVGASGSGKSTFLHLLGGLDRPTQGSVQLCGQPLAGLSEKAIGVLRNRSLGFVYQFHHLLPEFSALENVAMPLLIRGESHTSALSDASQLLEKVGLRAREHHKPGELSGGERQRTAVARALVGQPDCILADEPTGNLDYETANSVQELFFTLNSEFGTSLVMATHDLGLARKLDHTYKLANGTLQNISA